MNGRYHNNQTTIIHKLANQAHEETNTDYRERMKTEHPAEVIFYDMFNQRFAELIIRECMNLAVDDYNGYTISDKLKRHFNL